MKPIRLDKYLADAGTGTRSQVKQWIRQGRASVNGVPASGSDQKVDPQQDEIALDNQQIPYEPFVYYMMNKPSGYVSATRDVRERTVTELLPEEVRKRELFPVGRLDKDTEGLLLFTDDGALAHRLLSPKNHIPKTYYARIDGPVEEETVMVFAQGLDIGEKKPTLPGQLEILKSGEESEIRLTICEGKFHQVKRMFEAVGRNVLYLKRISMGTIKLDDHLPLGACRRLTDEERNELLCYKR